jgi:hypothetical protein
MRSFAMPQPAGSRWPLPMMDNPESSALMSGAKSQARLHVLCYQCAGGSNSAELLAREGGVWRCLTVEKISQVEFCKGAWHTEPTLQTADLHR